jgi:uncharacterized protein (TIGR03437 family)
MTRRFDFTLYSCALLIIAGNCAGAQANRVLQPVKGDQTRVIRGNTHPLAQAQYDLGPVDASLQMDHILLLFKPSASQQADLDQLLADQQNRSSANFHQWLTPEAFADRFGLSTNDQSKVVAWLQSQGLTVQESGRGRNWVAFSGTAGSVSSALRTPIHRYSVNGEAHIANSVEPSIPEALASVVGGFIGLDDFHLKPMVTKYIKIGSPPDYTSKSNNHYLAPEDYATIYDLNPLYKNSFDGTGQSIAIVGASDVAAADISAFRTRFNLPVNNPRMILYGADPGTNGNQIEGDLDLEWAGAIAPKATIYYVYGADPLIAAVYAVDLNIAPIISISYGNCEIEFPSLLYRTVLQQGNAQGITTLSASGDSGAAGCDSQGLDPSATRGQAATFPSNLPEVTGVGGTLFNDATGNYWASSNDAAGGSVLSYIPEVAWNETAPGFGLGASGGGASALITKPDWQTGPGVPNDNARDIPDVAMSAAVHDGYLVMYQNTLVVVGGTSASAPSLAGIVAMVNQYQVTRGFQKKAGLGNINPQLYRLAKATPAAFHDITAGNNIVPCAQGTPNCLNSSYGFTAGPGYDLVTGLGSIDGNNLVTLWNTASSPTLVTVTTTPSRLTMNDTLQLTATVIDPSGNGNPTGTVNFFVGGTALGTVPLAAGTASISVQAGTIAASQFLVPSNNPLVSFGATMTANYSGDATYSGASASAKIVVTIDHTVSAIVPTVNPTPVFAAPADAQGLSWQTIVTLQEIAGVPSTLTGFTIDGQPQQLPQYFPSTSILANGTLKADLILRNLSYPVTKVLGFTGIDASGTTWTHSLPVMFLGPQVFQNFNLSAAPLTMLKNSAADPSCQWSQLLTLDETGGFAFQIAGLAAGNIDITDKAQAIFGTTRLAPYGSLQGKLCWSGITAPASDVVALALGDEFGNILQTQVTVSFANAAANPITLSAVPASVTLQQVNSALLGSAALSLSVSDKTQTWTATVSPGNRTTSWLTLSQYSGTGPAQITLTASGVGFEPGVYRALITFQSPNAMPQTLTVPVMFVWGPSSNASGITSISWAANAVSYKTTVSPGQVLAVGGARLSNSVQQPSSLPLPYVADGVSATVNGIAAPLYYTSPTQLNIQVPYEAGAGPAVLGVYNNGLVAGYQMQITPSAPAIATDASGNIVPSAAAAQGGIAAMYMTGDGDVTPALPTGASPAAGTPLLNLPHPRLPVSVSVGGTQAFLQFVGITPGVVGLTQVNFVVPKSVPAGLQPVIVTVGGVSSAPAYLMVQTGS